jgi:hypothetical protein
MHCSVVIDNCDCLIIVRIVQGKRDWWLTSFGRRSNVEYNNIADGPRGWMSVGYALKGFWLLHLTMRCPSASPSIQRVAFLFYFILSGLTQGHVPARLGQRSRMAIWERREPMLLCCVQPSARCREREEPTHCLLKRWWLCRSCLPTVDDGRIKKIQLCCKRLERKNGVSFSLAGRMVRRERVSGHSAIFLVAPQWSARRWSWMSPFHLNRSPSVPTCLVCACTHTHCTGASKKKSRTLLPAALLPAYLTFAFCLLLLPLLSERRRNERVVTWSARLSLSTHSTRSVCHRRRPCLTEFFLSQTDSLNQLHHLLLATSTGTPAWEKGKRKLPPLVLLHPAKALLLWLCNRPNQTRTEWNLTSAVFLQLFESSSTYLVGSSGICHHSNSHLIRDFITESPKWLFKKKRVLLSTSLFYSVQVISATPSAPC